MKIAFDLDGTITAHPEFFKTLYDAWVAKTGSLPYILTARMERDREVTVAQLRELGMLTYIDPDHQLQMYPHSYVWPFKSADDEEYIKQQHTVWKVEMCRRLDVSILIDDCSRNAEACQRAGVFVLHVRSPIQLR